MQNWSEKASRIPVQFLNLSCIWIEVFRKGKDMTCGQVWCPIFRTCALQLTHPSAHTAVSSEHTQLKGLTSVMVLRVKESTVHSLPPTYNPCRYRDLNLRPLGYKSDSLTIRPRLPDLARFAIQIWMQNQNESEIQLYIQFHVHIQLHIKFLWLEIEMISWQSL